MTGSPTASAPHRAGVVALLGLPNAGKSTLLNHLLGAKLAIVTRKPQTTRSRILGVLSRPGAQLLLYDTPGLHRGTRPLAEAMNEAVEEVARDCDVALLLVDRTRGWRPAHEALLASVRRGGGRAFVVGTKSDRAGDAPWPPPELPADTPAFAVSARTGDGVEALLERVVAALPESPPFYDADTLTDRPVRWLAAELVREAVFEELAEELPYDVAVEVREFDESRPDLVRIRADLLVSRSSQKRIVVGAGGAVVRAIGIRARRQIETLLEQRVHLELFVKVDPQWSRRPNRLKALGYA